MNEIKNKIKLVIWDLDETYWKGTLSEEGVEYNWMNHDVVKELNKRGIVNSICSKNDFQEVQHYLKDKGIWEDFVFPEISWNPKGVAVKSIVSDMGLRPDNVLFIDDNLGNLNEVKYTNDGISVCEPSIIPELLNHKYAQGKDDTALTRLKQYKVLERKRSIKFDRNLSNLEFLYESNVRVRIHDIDERNIERVVELVERTNQLNYTKLRHSKSEILEVLERAERCGVISVADKYGDYGISGFFCVVESKLVHFLFSCRTMNMGVENWLYKQLGYPKLDVIGSVASQLDKTYDTSYINQKFVNKLSKNEQFISKNLKYLIIGGCDLEQLVHYLHGNVDTQFNFVNYRNISVHAEHSSMLNNKNLKKFQEQLKTYPILDGFDFTYKHRTTDWNVLIYSPLNDFSRGLYRHLKTGQVIAFDNFNIDWTDRKNHKELPLHLSSLTLEELDRFSRDFEYIGPIGERDFEANIRALVKEFKGKQIILLTGSEVKLTNVSSWESGMEERHSLLNVVLTDLEGEYDNLSLVDVRQFCLNDNSHSDNIRHYSKSVYLDIAKDIANKTDLKIKSGVFSSADKLRRRVLKKIKKIIERIC
ncbi:hypothetical protein [Vibrio sp. 10N.222.51.C5]|uniref:hypothetical protein n=1 Tax=Vibrio sp. 10N.222.51.C5 TaxID=3229623 RepID=UPI00354C5DE9